MGSQNTHQARCIQSQPACHVASQCTRSSTVAVSNWAAGYNIVAIPLAAGLLAPAGILLNPAIGAVLMSLSTVIVAVNAQLLRRVTL